MVTATVTLQAANGSGNRNFTMTGKCAALRGKNPWLTASAAAPEVSL